LRYHLYGSTVHVPQYVFYQMNESAQVWDAIAVEALLMGQTTLTKSRTYDMTKVRRGNEESVMHPHASICLMPPQLLKNQVR
jgi:hypothetical protein